MLLSQPLWQVCEKSRWYCKAVPKSLSKGRKMHMDTTRDFISQYWWSKEQMKISCLQKIIVMRAVIDRNMTSASVVHVLFCITQLGTAWIGCKRDSSWHILYSQKILQGDENLNLRGIFSQHPTSIQAVFLQLLIWPLLSFSSLPLTCSFRFVMTKGCWTVPFLMGSEL